MVTFKKALILIFMGLLLFVYSGPMEAAAAPPAQEGQPQADEPIRYEPIGQVTVSRLNVRSGPSTQNQILTAIPYGERIYLIGRSTPGNWLQVRLFNGQQGWVMTQYVSASQDDINSLPVTDTHQIPGEAIGSVLSPRLNVRMGPGFDQRIIGQLWQGEQIPLVGRNATSAWLQVRLPSGSKGWVAAQYIHSSVPIYNLPVVDGGSPVPPPNYSGIVTVPSLNVRSGPGLYNPVITRLNQGNSINILGRDYSGNWFKVSLYDGTTGWVMARYVQIDIPVTNLQVM
jgi:N-acetylmuramoyl-L-alanine amidase